MMEDGEITARSGCDALLQNDKLSYENSHVWTITFKMLRKHIGECLRLDNSRLDAVT